MIRRSDHRMRLRKMLAACALASLVGLRAAVGAEIAEQDQSAKDPVVSTTVVALEHVTIRSHKPFEAVRSALEEAVPALDGAYAGLVRSGRTDEARTRLEHAAPLSIFGSRDHGALLRIAGLERRAIQYDIGNPLTATRMTRHELSAALYAPIRVLLRESVDGVAFEYDRPISTFGQFDDGAVDRIARKLDDQLRSTLTAAAG